ncbi:hypothetical protein E2C01_084150 [Portunus trituberculatus]|uniref:Uncharacterized protein n=1 Tax=Portunus trituberculatus TaxID=210409 RepID=A0A5B7J9X7_PORTR|nr:hypothetical protein [Portunus trituberculatus]
MLLLLFIFLLFLLLYH